MGLVPTVDGIDSVHSAVTLVGGLPKHLRACAEQGTDQQDSAPKLPATVQAENV